MEPKQKQHPVVDVTGDRSKIRCCKEQYYVGTWNVRSMNQGKLEVVKQGMARVNVNILGISALRWTGMGEFNSDDHYIYYCGQESLRRNRVAIIVNKTVQNAVLGCSLKNGRMISCLFPRQTIQYHGNPRLYPDQSRWRSWSWTVLWRPTRPSRTNIQKRCPFHYRGLEVDNLTSDSQQDDGWRGEEGQNDSCLWTLVAYKSHVKLFILSMGTLPFSRSDNIVNQSDLT